MTINSQPVRASGSDDPAFADLVEELTARFQAGEPVDLEACLREHAEYADRLRPLLPALTLLGEVSRSGPHLKADLLAGADGPEPPSGVLGDFRIVREVGRGGMGVVYEAEQVSLGRRVALKVLPLAGGLDPRQLQRFRNEARAAAGLHHTNIVPVHAVGSERGVHFYAMQLIEGRTLAAVVKDRKSGIEDRGSPATPVASTAEARAAGTTERTPRSSTLDPPSAFFRQVAELAAQAAEALDYAHQMGVVHRDIKPANLMLDGRGAVWITDFGLAQLQTDAGLTLTGDLLGTLRYMSPEQALAKRVPIDHRTDVYSLGATLYELLTLRPVFDGADRQDLLRQIAFDDPAAPRRLNRAIPAELETVVLKALEKNPADRYATAQEMADDLRRMLADKPIQARRPTLLQRARKWARRHRDVVGTAAAVLLLAGFVGFVALAIGYAELDAAYLAEAVQLKKAEEAAKAEQAATKKALDAAESESKAKTAAESAAVAEGLAKLKAEKAAAAEKLANELAQKRLGQLEKANEILVSIFRDLDPYSAKKERLSLHDQLVERLNQAAAALVGEAVGDELAVARLQEALGQAYLGIGEPAKAFELLTNSHRTFKANFGENHLGTLRVMARLATAHQANGRPGDALAMSKEVFERLNATLSPDHPEILTAMAALGDAFVQAGDVAKALPLLKESLDKQKAKLGKDDGRTLTTMDNLALAYLDAGQPGDALPLLVEALETKKEKLGPNHPGTLSSKNNLALACRG
jgi:serine/threonine protein kinase